MKKPVLEMPATIKVRNRDLVAGRVVEIKDNGNIVIQEDRVEHVNRAEKPQVYKFHKDTAGLKREFRVRDGAWFHDRSGNVRAELGKANHFVDLAW